MTLKENETINNKAEIERQGKPFKWGDESETPEATPESENDDQSFTSVADVLEFDRKLQTLLLNEYFKNNEPNTTENKNDSKKENENLKNTY